MKRYCLFLIAIMCAACGVSDLEVQVLAPDDATQRAALRATAQPRDDGFLYYQAPDALDLSFYYPQGWQVEATTNRLWVSHPQGTLHIALGRQYNVSTLPDFNEDLFLGERDTLAVHGIEVNPRVVDIPTRQAIVLYSPRGGLRIGDLRIGLWLETTDTQLDADWLAQVDTLLESMRFAWLGTPPDSATLSEWIVFEDGDTSLALSHPTTWQVSAGEHHIELRQDDIILRIVHGNLTARSGLPAGEFRKLGAVVINEQTLPALGLIYEEKTKMVLYGDPHTTAQLGEMRIFAELQTVGQGDYADLHISEAIQREAGQILATLRTESD